ncbi:MAG: SMP-30/gluconolactonase/LRE family protein [Ardenticatenaceae bacterium]
MNVECAFRTKDILGEGPVWSIEEQALYWVDIERPALQRWNPATGEHKVWQMPSQIGSYALREGGEAVVALRTGLAWLDLGSGDVTPIVDPEADMVHNRFNDGACDRQGRFWAGTMHLTGNDPSGSLYRFDPDGTLTKMRTPVWVSNGLGWSPDNRIMYYADSPTGHIYAYDFDPDTGNISNERIFAHTDDGYPDGLTVDAEGYVWSAKWDGWRIVRYAPDGSIDREIKMPVQRPTSCMFGGPELRHLFITSATVNLTEEELAPQPLAGSVLVIETDVAGLPEPRFAG